MGILQARIVEWVAIPSSRGSSQPRDQTQVSGIIGRFFTSWGTRETQSYHMIQQFYFRKENKDNDLKRFLNPPFHQTTIYNSQDMETH